MKRAIFFAVGFWFIVFALMGCFGAVPSVQVRPIDEAFVAGRAGVHAGAILAKEMPDQIDVILPIVDGFLGGMVENAELCQQVESVLLPHVKDPLLRSDIMAFLNLLEIDAPLNIEMRDAILEAAARGFVEGAKLLR